MHPQLGFFWHKLSSNHRQYDEPRCTSERLSNDGTPIIRRAQLFFVASQLTGNNTLVDMAISHADKTIENHVRPDGERHLFHETKNVLFIPVPFLGSSYHVVEYDSSTGLVTRRRTAQGYSDERWEHSSEWTPSH